MRVVLGLLTAAILFGVLLSLVSAAPGDDEIMSFQGRITDKDGFPLTGSYNFTVAASEVNYENLVAIQSTTVAGSYSAEYERIKSKKKR